MPGPGRPFAKGNPGRKPGSRNRAGREIRDIARGLLEDSVYQRKLRLRLLAGTAGQVELALFHYAYGKPQDRLQVTGATPDMDYEQARESLRRKLETMLMNLPVDGPVDAAETTPAPARTIPASMTSPVKHALRVPTAPAPGVELLQADEPAAPAPADPPTVPASSPDRGGLVDNDGALALADRLSAARSPRLWRTRH